MLTVHLTLLEDSASIISPILTEADERSLSGPILQVRNLRLQEPKVPMLAPSFYPLHPEHAASGGPECVGRREKEWGKL